MNNTISFQGRTSLIGSEKIYNGLKEKAQKLQKHIIPPNNTRQFNLWTTYTTEPDAENIAIILSGKSKNFLSYVQIGETLQNFSEKINSMVKFLKSETQEKLTAWIIGGHHLEGIKGNKTIRTVNEIADILCDRPDIDTSILAGSKEGLDKIGIHKINDKLEIIVGKDIDYTKPLDIELEKHFDIVELNNVFPQNKI